LSSVQSAPARAAAMSSNTNTEPTSLRSWIEILGITAIVPLGLFGIHPGDPFLIRAGFPWLVLVPLLIGAQHGVLGALVSSALLSIAAWLVDAQAPASALWAWSGGCLAAGVISGHFRDRVATRLAHLNNRVEEYGSRLVRLSRAHAVLELSHQRLSDRLSAQTWSLDTAVADARQRLATCDSLASSASIVLNVLLNHAMVQSASLLLVAPKGSSSSAPLPLELSGQLGPARSVDVRHPLIERAVLSGRLVAIDVHAEASADPSILAAVPLSTTSGVQLGVLVVHEMPFMAFQAGHLKNLAALALHLSDLMSEAAAPGPRPKTGGDGSAEGNDFDGTRTGTRVREPVARSA
jgi:polysaccharide biosynthesis protein PelD